MPRFVLGASATLLVFGGLLASASAADMPACPPPHRHHAPYHVAHRVPQVIYSRRGPPAPREMYHREDNGRDDDANASHEGQRQLAYGQPPSWLDGYGTRPITYGAYGTYNVYGGSAQVMPFGLPPAGGLAVYEPGGFGPGPTIIRVPDQN